ncbi:MAG TPA: ATP-binding protein [Polyangiales bacterium]|nr:ATP-binding protein [Polyangiales bacterium]
MTNNVGEEIAASAASNSVPPSRTTALLRQLAQQEVAPTSAAAIACVLTILAAVGDWVTGADAAFTLFYVLPLALAVWFVSLRMGMAIALLSVLAGTLCDVFGAAGSRPTWYFILWNNVVEAGLYTMFAHLLAAVRERVAREIMQRAQVVDKLRVSERLSSTGKLAAGVAHEISVPLDRICKQVASRGGVNLSSEIQLQAERIRTVVHQLLNFSERASSGVQRADIKSLVDETLAILQPIADKGGVQIVQTGDSVEAQFNSAEIQQVVTNLVTNAIQAMPEGGTLEIMTDATLANVPGRPRGDPEPFARITVRDHGVGISPDALPCIFDPFVAHESIADGARLGLSVSYQIIEEHGGWITVDTRLGEGTSFHVHLPC